MLPLIRFLESPRSEGDERQRVIAAKIVADMAQPRAIPDLIALLANPHPEVRSYAAEGLFRLTGKDQGRAAPEWRADWLVCEPTHKTWQQWWEANQDRYPGAPRTSLVKRKKG